jgi:hypothetical protein
VPDPDDVLPIWRCSFWLFDGFIYQIPIFIRFGLGFKVRTLGEIRPSALRALEPQIFLVKRAAALLGVGMI